MAGISLLQVPWFVSCRTGIQITKLSCVLLFFLNWTMTSFWSNPTPSWPICCIAWLDQQWNSLLPSLELSGQVHFLYSLPFSIFSELFFLSSLVNQIFFAPPAPLPGFHSKSPGHSYYTTDLWYKWSLNLHNLAFLPLPWALDSHSTLKVHLDVSEAFFTF